jgi:3-methyladenine DNA glycosylase AlkD
VVAQRFFKTGPGDYGAGDRFLGIRVPVLRALAREFAALPLPQVERLLQSHWHEERLLALLILVQHFRRAEAAAQLHIQRLYLRNIDRINNWDLVDSSAEHILGPALLRGTAPWLRRFTRSDCLWERRVAVLSTFYLIRRGRFSLTLRLARELRNDPDDLIHKAVGWMLREVAKRDRAVVERFLRQHAHRMPRTMLRYAIERFPDRLRRRYLAARVA